MKVTGRRAATGTHSTKTAKTVKPPKKKEPKAPSQGAQQQTQVGWPGDGFDAPKAPPAATRTGRPNTGRGVQATPAVVQRGADRLERDKSLGGEWLKEAGLLLGGVTASVVVNVFHQFETKPNAELDWTVERLGELCGALFVEFLSPEDGRDVVELVRDAAKDANGFDAKFKKAFGTTPLEATSDFIDFISETEGKPQARLADSIYGE